jgi:hypothetical protein
MTATIPKMTIYINPLEIAGANIAELPTVWARWRKAKARFCPDVRNDPILIVRTANFSACFDQDAHAATGVLSTADTWKFVESDGLAALIMKRIERVPGLGTHTPDLIIANTFPSGVKFYDDPDGERTMDLQILWDAPRKEHKYSLFGNRYPTPAYCGQCDQVLDGWFEVTVGVGELSQHRWQCPRCGMKVPDELMQSDNPHIEKEKTNVTALVVHDETNAALSVDERTEFQQLETVIQVGLQTFFEVGNALMEIRDRRLYREAHETFEDYCNQRWQFSKSQANRLIGAAQVVETLAPIGVIPKNEAQARPLTQLAPERRAEVWQRAVATAPDGQVTAKHVQQVVDEVLGKAGRFENLKFYPVNDRDQEIYRQPRSTSPSWNEEQGILYGCNYRSGERLNQEKGYDAYAFVDVPDYVPAIAIDQVIPTPKEKYFEFPVSEKEKTIYLDPINSYSSRPGYYNDCEWVRYAELTLRWGSHLYRYGDFQIAPALEPPTTWLAEARFQPGMHGKCSQCEYTTSKGIYPYAKWAIDGDGIWRCPNGHRKADPKMDIFAQGELPAPAILPPPPPKKPRLPLNLDEVMDALYCLHDVLKAIRNEPALVKDALKSENIAIYNNLYDWQTPPFSDVVVAATQHLMAWIELFSEEDKQALFADYEDKDEEQLDEDETEDLDEDETEEDAV